MLAELGLIDEELDTYDRIDSRFWPSESTGILVFVAKALVHKAVRLNLLKRWEEAITVCDVLTQRFVELASPELIEPVGYGLLLKSVMLGELGRNEEQLLACTELLGILDRHNNLATDGALPEFDPTTGLELRLHSHEIRLRAYVEQGDGFAAARDVQAIVRILPQLSALPETTIKSLMLGSIEVGFDRMATLIRESPSADRLLALTTALELERGMKPRVAKEIQQVAEDIQRDLERLRERRETTIKQPLSITNKVA